MSAQLHIQGLHSCVCDIKLAHGRLWQAYLASLVLFEEACGARRHRLSGKWVGSKANSLSDLVTISQQASPVLPCVGRGGDGGYCVSEGRSHTRREETRWRREVQSPSASPSANASRVSPRADQMPTLFVQVLRQTPFVALSVIKVKTPASTIEIHPSMAH